MMNKESKYINVKGQLMDLSEPRVMGILNVTPDSFYSESRLQTVEKIAARVVEIVNEGADFIDIGAYSSRSNADHVSLEEEMNRLRMGHGFGIGNETKVKNWLQEAVIFWEAHR